MNWRIALIQTISPVVLIHMVAALAALLLGAAVLWRRKGTRLHRNLGKLWVTLLLTVAVSSFWINDMRQVGPFSWIHLLSIYTIVSLAIGIGVMRMRSRYGAARALEIHRHTMQNLYAGALLIAGAFTLLPGRLTGRLLFGPDMPALNVAVLVAMCALGGWLIVRTRRTMSATTEKDG